MIAIYERILILNAQPTAVSSVLFTVRNRMLEGIVAYYPDFVAYPVKFVISVLIQSSGS